MSQSKTLFLNIPPLGTFRPDRIRSVADRFGVDGDMALENILYGTPNTSHLSVHGLILISVARAFNSEHQVCLCILLGKNDADYLRDGAHQ